MIDTSPGVNNRLLHRTTSRPYWLCFGLVLFLAGAFRAYVVSVHFDEEGGWTQGAKFEKAAKGARRILEDRDFSVVFDTPGDGREDTGYSLFIAGVWWLFGKESLTSYHLVVFLLDLLALGLLMGMVLRLFGRGTSLLFGVIMAFYLPGVYNALVGNLYILVYYLTVFILALTFWFPRRALFQLVSSVFIGGLTIFTLLMRSTFLLFAFIPALFILLKFWGRRGFGLAVVILTVSFGGSYFFKVVLDNPTHQFWHAFFVGLGEFPNHLGLEDKDQVGFRKAYEIRRDSTKYDREYLETLKNYALTLIDEDRPMYLRTLGNRLLKVLYAPQRWFLYHLSLTKELERGVSILIVVAAAIGLGIALWERKLDSLLFLFTFLYFSLTLVPIISTHGVYYYPSSVMLLIFASSALPRILPAGIPSRPAGGSTEWRTSSRNWPIDPLTPRILFPVILGSIATAAVALAGFLVFAHTASEKWRLQMLEKITASPVIARWGAVPVDRMRRGRVNPVVVTGSLEPGKMVLFHSILKVARGRVGLQVRDEKGRERSPVVSTSAPGTVHCFLSWVPDTDGPVSLHAWDVLPTDLTPGKEAWERLCILKSFRHYRVRDHAKTDWFPTNRVDVSSSLVGWGGRKIPFQLNKFHRNIFGQPLLPFWRSRVPSSVTVEFEHRPEISQLVLTQKNRPLFPFQIRIRRVGNSIESVPAGATMEMDEKTGKCRVYFTPVRVASMKISFVGGGKDRPFLDLTDVSIPDPAVFEIVSTTLYQVGVSPETKGFPLRLSFLDP